MCPPGESFDETIDQHRNCADEQRRSCNGYGDDRGLIRPPYNHVPKDPADWAGSRRAHSRVSNCEAERCVVQEYALQPRHQEEHAGVSVAGSEPAHPKGCQSVTAVDEPQMGIAAVHHGRQGIPSDNDPLSVAHPSSYLLNGEEPP